MKFTNDQNIDLSDQLSLFHHSPLAVCFASLDGDILGTNEAMCDLTGFTSKELINQKIWQLEYNADEIECQKLIGQFKNAATKNAERHKIYNHKNGDLIYIQESMSIADYGENADRYIMVLSTKQSDGYQTEQKDLKIYEYLHKAIESTSAYISVLDLDGKIEYANKVTDGIQKEEFIGSSIHLWLTENQSNVLNENLKKILLEKKDIFYESEFIDPTGQMHYLYHDMSPIFIDGDISAITFVTNDTTELKLLQENLTRNLDLITLGLQAADMGVWDWNSINAELVWDENLYKILGSKMSEINASFDTLLNVMHDEDKERVTKETLLALESRLKYEGEFRIHRLDNNELRWISFKSKFTTDSENQITRLLGIAWDNTDMKELEIEKQRTSELERQNIELQQFAYLASHDLKSPLRTINNFSGLLTKRYSNQLDETANLFLDHIQNAGHRMEHQIKDLLDYAMLGHNKEFISVDCDTVLKNVIKDLDFFIQNSSGTIQVDTLPIVSGLKTEITLLFENLISNAIKFRKENKDPIIKISSIEKEVFFEFCVADNGIGIEDLYKEKVFVLFQRLHLAEEFEGTGIGLAHCKKIVELHGGQIWVEANENDGCSFYFTIQKNFQ